MSSPLPPKSKFGYLTQHCQSCVQAAFDARSLISEHLRLRLTQLVPKTYQAMPLPPVSVSVSHRISYELHTLRSVGSIIWYRVASPTHSVFRKATVNAHVNTIGTTTNHVLENATF